MIRRAIDRWLQRVWYGDSAARWVLLPLSLLYGGVGWLRKSLFRAGVFKSEHPGVPVIVIGNLTAGGTGKTPVTIWLAAALKERGFNPGIVSRGYGGSKSGSPMRVDGASDPAVVGDEPVLLARRTGLPVAVDSDRSRAARTLVEEGVDLIVTDDGLQHLKLERDYEICVIDGSRGLGNRLLLPAGPLREPATRLEQVDQILVNGRCPDDAETANEQNAIGFELRTGDLCRLNGSLTRPIERFANTTVHGVAAIGNPSRFFDTLRAAGMQVIEHPLPDHVKPSRSDLSFGDDFDVVMTEKDAVKLGSNLSDRYWYIPVDLYIDPVEAGPWLEHVVSRLRRTAEDVE